MTEEELALINRDVYESFSKLHASLDALKTYCLSNGELNAFGKHSFEITNSSLINAQNYIGSIIIGLPKLQEDEVEK